MTPWELQVRFTRWPDEQLVRLDLEGRVMHDAFINSVKEVGMLEVPQFWGGRAWAFRYHLEKEKVMMC